jgi:hypothetical protein
MALLGAVAVGGAWMDSLWGRVAIAAIILLAIPLLIADRLLPKEPGQRRPGLVRDVLGFCWAGSALAFVGLAGSLTGEPLRAEAERLDDQGHSRAAWLGRWMAGPAPTVELAPTEEPAPLDAPPTQLADAELPSPAPAEAAPVDAPAPAPEPEPADAEATDEEADPPPDTPAPALVEFSPAELFASYAPAVVSIKIEHGGFRSGGTGFFIDDRGTIATNHHVIRDAREVRIKLWDGTELDRVELLTSDPEVDLALVRVDPNALPDTTAVAQLGDSEAVKVGEPVSVIGNPLGLDHTLTEGIVSSRRVYEGERYIQMSAPISPGNSGGPVFDRHGRVIGVSVAQMVGGQNLNLAVPVSQLQAMIADDYPNRRSFGASSW